MAGKDLTDLIVKCIKKAFPDADTSKGSPAWNMVVVPVAQYVDASPFDLPIRDYIKNILQTKFPGKLELDKDGVLDDLVMKPFEALAAPFTREIYQVRRRQSIADLRIHTVESISDLAANYGIVPRPGDYARGAVRVYYPAPVNEVAVPETYFETGNGLRFFTVSTQKITASQMSLNMDGDLYYWDIRIVAQRAGTAYNVAAGTIVRAPTLARAVKVSNLYKLSNGLSQDSVEDISAEMGNYPCTRSIGTRRGIAATIMALLGGAKVVEVVGMGDPEMQRDIIRGGEVDHEYSLYPTTGLPVKGTRGVGVPDGTPYNHTRWFEDTYTAGVNFVDLFGTSSADITGYYLVAAWIADPLKFDVTWWISRITKVLSATRIQIEDSVLPVNQVDLPTDANITWMICPAKLRLSKLPGGILWPDTPEGEVVIRDNEIHVGGCTDVFLLGASTESTSTDLAALSDETLLGFGTGGEAVASSHDFYIHDASMLTTVLAASTYSKISHDGATTTVESLTFRWGMADLDPVEAGQVFVWPGATSFPPVPGRYRILRLESAPSTYRLRLVVEDPGNDIPGAGVVGGTIIKRKRGARKDACLQILSSPISGDRAGFYKILFELEGASTDAWPGCQYRLIVDKQFAATPTPLPALVWRMSDTIDIDLFEPKVAKVTGTDLMTFAGSDGVNSIATDFSLYGVKAGDILKITGGPDSGINYVLKRDPFGPGSAFLQLNKVLTASAIVSYTIYSSSTPIALPLLSVTKVSLLDADGGAVGVDVPYGAALGAYSSKFTNLSSGVKITDNDAVAGIRTVVGVADTTPGPGPAYDPAANPLALVVWHRQLSYQPVLNGGTPTGALPWDIPLVEGGFMRPIFYEFVSGPSAPYDLGLASGWNDLVDDLNSGALRDPAIPAHLLAMPYPFFSWEEVTDSAGVLRRYLLVRPFGSAQMLLGFKAALSGNLNFGEFIDYNPVSGLGELGYHAVFAGYGYTKYHVMSKDLYLAYGFGSTSPPLARLQDMVDVFSGSNVTQKDLLLDVGSTPNIQRRIRMRGPHALSPEGSSGVRVGFPSSGMGRTYFKDATDFEVNSGTTRYTSDDGGQVYWPDPMLKAVIVPFYPETAYPDTGFVQALFVPVSQTVFTDTSANFFTEMILPGDTLEILYRDIITTTAWADPPVPFIPATAQELTIRETGTPGITVSFPIPLVGYTLPQLVGMINAVFGQTIAYVEDSIPAVPGFKVLRLRWQKEITVGGSALAAGGLFGPVAPAATSNRAVAYGQWTILNVGPTSFSTSSLLLRGLPPSAADVNGCRVQYKILRAGVQRFSAQQMAPTDGPGPFLYADVELLSWGVGNEFNIESDLRMSLSGYWCRGYRLSAEDNEMTYSMAEVPWIQLNNYFQPVTAADDPQEDQVILGSGVRIFYDRSPLVSAAQALLNSSEERDNNQSVLARHLFPHYVSMDVDYAGGALESVVKPEVEALITGRSPREPLDVSDVMGVITQLGANHVDTPIMLAVLRHNEDRTQDVLIGKDRVETSRLTGFLPGTINLTRRP